MGLHSNVVVATCADSITAITGASSNDVWVLSGSLDETLLFHWDGTSCSLAHVDTGSTHFFEQANDLFAAGPNDVWILDLDRLLHWDGSALAVHDAPSSARYAARQFAGFATDDLWAGGGDNATMHWDGAAWSGTSLDVGSQPLTIWGCTPDDLWLGGQCGTIIHRTP